MSCHHPKVCLHTDWDTIDVLEREVKSGEITISGPKWEYCGRVIKFHVHFKRLPSDVARRVVVVWNEPGKTDQKAAQSVISACRRLVRNHVRPCV